MDEKKQKDFSSLSEETINEMEMENAEGGKWDLNPWCKTNNCSGGNCADHCGAPTTPASYTSLHR